MRNYHFFKVFMIFLFSSSRKTHLMEGEGEGEKEEEKNTVKCKRREGGRGGEEEGPTGFPARKAGVSLMVAIESYTLG